MSEPLGTSRPRWRRVVLIVAGAIAGGCCGFFGAAWLARSLVKDDGLILVRGAAVLEFACVGMLVGALAAVTATWCWTRRWRSQT